MITCSQCKSQYPIIKKIPILWNSFENYLSTRPSLGGYLFTTSINPNMKKFIKTSLCKILPTNNDQSIVERRWTQIYQNNKTSEFYNVLYKKLSELTNLGLVLEYGCSIGLFSSKLTTSVKHIFGIDISFSSIDIAKRTFNENSDYFVTDSMFSIFGKLKFDTILALNLLELVEPISFLTKLTAQAKKYIVISDPYDYDRGTKSVKNPVYEKELRRFVRKLNFSLIQNTKNPSEIPWTLMINNRCYLNYKVDLLVAKRK